MTDMTPEARAELRRLADAATPGGWSASPAGNGNPADGPTHHEVRPEFVQGDARTGFTVATTDYDEMGWHDAAFIAAANPETVKALLDESEEARAGHARAQDGLIRAAEIIAALSAERDAALARAEAAESAVERVRALHVPDDHGPGRCDGYGCVTVCEGCYGDYPCSTLRALDTTTPTDREDDR